MCVDFFQFSSVKSLQTNQRNNQKYSKDSQLNTTKFVSYFKGITLVIISDTVKQYNDFSLQYTRTFLNPNTCFLVAHFKLMSYCI